MFERVWTVCNDSAAASTINLDSLALPGGNPELEIAAWQSASVSLPVLIMGGTVPLSTAQYQTSSSGPVDAVLAVPMSGVAKCRYDNDIRTLTVFFPAAVPAGDFQYVTIRIREKKAKSALL